MLLVMNLCACMCVPVVYVRVRVCSTNLAFLPGIFFCRDDACGQEKGGERGPVCEVMPLHVCLYISLFLVRVLWDTRAEEAAVAALAGSIKTLFNPAVHASFVLSGPVLCVYGFKNGLRMLFSSFVTYSMIR